MKAGFDLSAVGATSPGIGRYIVELAGAFARVAPAGSVVPISHRAREAGPTFPSRRAWTHVVLPAWLPRAGLDLVHYPAHDGPLVGRTPAVVTIHDLSWLTDPGLHRRRRVLRARLVLGRLARRAAAVIVPSEATAAAVATHLGIRRGRLHVTPLAPAPSFRPIDADAARAAAARLDVPAGAYLFVGTIEPRKNLAAVLDALAILRRTERAARLVVVGAPGWGVSLPAEVRRRGLGSTVTWLRGIGDEDLAAILSGSTALVAPSLDEGFGLPVVEAMAVGLPVITSHAGAQAEVAGGAALVVDPRDPSAIAAAMQTLRDDASVAADLRARGLARAATFSWTRTARETLAVYHSV
ncbi:MAG TPA: glycosyltransferase family 1 protein, partial [Candidatus Limnocylindrales bacterium]|nr:glycosyltransferase family 1 protein [Candidatus Limnocylindrales bacterium]